MSAAAPATTNDATTTASTSTEPKINGQIDERTGVAPIVALAAIPGESCLFNGVTNVQAQLPCSFADCLSKKGLQRMQICSTAVIGPKFLGPASQGAIDKCNFMGGIMAPYNEEPMVRAKCSMSAGL